MDTTSRTVRYCCTPDCWRTIPIRLIRSRSRRAGSWPSTRTSPALRDRYPSRTSTVVVLPAPLGPSIAKISPRSTRRSMPRTASRLPYDLRRPWTSMATSPPAAPLAAVTDGRWRWSFRDEDGPHRGHEAERHEGDQRQRQQRNPQVLLHDLVLGIAMIDVQVVDGVDHDLLPFGGASRLSLHGRLFTPC